MIDAVLTGAVLGLFAGLIPGPYTALVAGKALHRGLRAGLRLALVPLVTEIPPMVAAAVTLANTDRDVLRWIGVAGGALFVALGVRLFLRSGDAGVDEGDQNADEEKGRRARTFLGVATAGLLSPAPWIFWFVVAGPLMVGHYRRGGWATALAMGGAFLVLMIGTAAALAWGASRGRSLPPRWQRRLVRGAAAFLVVAGGVLVWQAAAGNFQGVMEEQKALLDLLP